MPTKTTVMRWLGDETYKAFRDQYTGARELQAETMADDILDIADDGRNDWMEKRNGDGEAIGWQENGEALKRSALRIEARKWLAGKLKPKKYGDRTQMELSGPDGGPVKITRIELVPVAPSSTKGQ
ncbi:MAG: terminase small subunit protein [Devosia sp.]|nr:terminase small subunit protein [Devosia sp.]MBF0678055.1 terminase small subunit protein [Devosia sp.]